MTSNDANPPQSVYPNVLDVVLSTDPGTVQDVTNQIIAMADGEAKAALSEMLVSAMNVRQEFAKVRRRESELQVLFDTASDLSSLRSVDEVLDAVASRVRRLFGADSGYLALIDEKTGDAYMRVTSGTVTSAIGSVRLRPGVGLGGAIIKTGRPFVTPDYFNDPTIEHDPYVAEAVRADGIRSIAGAPIALGQTTIGALFVASRATQQYEASDIALLSSLADHVAILLDNSRLFEAQRDASESLERTNQLLHEQQIELQNLAEFHNRLTGLVLERTSRQRYSEIAAEYLDAAVVYIDERGRVLATVGREKAVDHLISLSDSARQRTGTVFARAERLDETTHDTWWVTIRAGSSHFGNMLFLMHEEPSPATIQLLEQAAQTAALLELTERRTMLEEEQLRRELLGDLLTDRPTDWDHFSRRAERSGLSIITAPQRVLIISASSEASLPQVAEVCSQIAASAGGIAAEYTNEVVLVLPERLFASGEAAYIAQLRYEIERNIGKVVLTGGLAGPAVSGPAVRALYQEASRYLRIARALNMHGQIVDKASLGPLGLVLESTSRPLVEAMLEQKLGPLLDYDADHEALLVPTLEAYFEAGQNPRAASAALFVHPNTVYQRLSRVSQILGGDEWREPRGALEMQLALQFHQVIKTASDSIIPERSLLASDETAPRLAQSFRGASSHRR